MQIYFFLMVALYETKALHEQDNKLYIKQQTTQSAKII